jgi:hypothetical protein
MKDKIKILVCILALLLGLLWIFYFSRLGYASTTFAGPGFHSQNANDTRAVSSELYRHLGGLGFQASASPSEFDSWAGLHSEGASRLWFSKDESRNQTTFLYVDLEETAVRTSIKWEAYGTDRKRESAKLLAYSRALDLDAWFEGLKEANAVPQKIREEKRRNYQKHLAEDKRS